MAEKGQEKTGRWSAVEHERFLQGLELYGKNWKQVCVVVGTRSAIQTRTHAQKYLAKLSAPESLAITHRTLTESAPALTPTTPLAVPQIGGQHELQLMKRSKRQPTGTSQLSEQRTTKRIKHSTVQSSHALPAPTPLTTVATCAPVPDITIALVPQLSPPSPAPSCSPSSSSAPTSPASASLVLSTTPVSQSVAPVSKEKCWRKAINCTC